MIFLLAIIILLSVISIVTAVFVFLFYDINDKKINTELRKKTIRSEEELMNIVFNILERKWSYRVNFHFKLKEIKIPKFEYELHYLLTEVIKSLSLDVMEELKYYYKDEDTVIKTVSEIIQIFLLNYMDNHGVKHNE